MFFLKSKAQCLSLILGLTGLINLPASQLPSFAQAGEQAADQSAFQDDGELLQLNNAQVRQLEGQEQFAANQGAQDAGRTQAYRLFAQKKVQELEKLKGTNPQNDKQIAVLQNWLNADTIMRARDQQTIRSLQQRIANLEQSQQQVMNNLGGDVSSLRQDSQDARADDKFHQMMSTNYFNEMQTEMGPASWNERPNGVSYSMGGTGFNGGQNLIGGY